MPNYQHCEARSGVALVAVRGGCGPCPQQHGNEGATGVMQRMGLRGGRRRGLCGCETHRDKACAAVRRATYPMCAVSEPEKGG